MMKVQVVVKHYRMVFCPVSKVVQLAKFVHISMKIEFQNIDLLIIYGSDEYSLKRASKLLLEVARNGENSGYGVPCLLIAAKNDLNLYPMAIKDSEMVCQVMKINAPILISVKEKQMNNIFQKIVTTTQQCHLSVPETEHGRNKKRYLQLVNRSLILASVGAAAIIAMAAYRAYAGRKANLVR